MRGLQRVPWSSNSIWVCPPTWWANGESTAMRSPPSPAALPAPLPVLPPPLWAMRAPATMSRLTPAGHSHTTAPLLPHPLQPACLFHCHGFSAIQRDGRREQRPKGPSWRSDGKERQTQQGATWQHLELESRCPKGARKLSLRQR